MCVDGGHGPGCPNYRHVDCNVVDARFERLRGSWMALAISAIFELVAIIYLVFRG